MPYIDLQLHSTYSDGKYTPTEIAEYLHGHGVKVAAITDHNTVGGINEFFLACKERDIKPISGIELYVRYGSSKVNILFYNFDQHNAEFHAFLRKTQIQRHRNVAKALRYWKNQGMDINVEKILSQYNHYVPINGVVRSIRKSPINRKRIMKDLNRKKPHEWEVIKYYFKDRKKYYLEETHVDFRRLKKLHSKIGGQMIVAHAGKSSIKGALIISMLKNKLIDGMEILSPHHGWDDVSYYQHELSDCKSIIFTGGSDFHGPSSDDGSDFIDSAWEYFKINSRFLPNIEKIIGKV